MTSKTQAVQTELKNVVSIMNNNVERVVARGEDLASMQVRSEQLANSSTQFRQSATRVRRQLWWKNTKLQIGVALLGTVIIGLIVWGVVKSK